LHFSIETDDDSDEKAIKIDPKSFDMKPVQMAPKIEISGGVYLIPSEKVRSLVNSVTYTLELIFAHRRRL
jgi:hypothetical protein